MSLRKVIIYAFGDENHAGSEIGRFVLPINPESYKRSHQIQLEDTQNPGAQSNNSKHARTTPEEFNLEFMLDGTKTVEGNMMMDVPVSKQVKQFLDLTYKMNGDIRKPNFLKIVWDDDFVFDCQLSKADVNYTLFRPDGSPLRAKVSATFREHKAPKIKVSEEGRVSNTQNRVENALGSGNRLANVVKSASSSNKIMDIAKANDMANLRKTLPDNAQLVVPADAGVNKPFEDGVKMAQSAANEARNVAQNASNAARSAQAVVAGANDALRNLRQGNLSGAVNNAKDAAKNAQDAINTAKNAAQSAKNAAEQAKNAAKNAKTAAQNTASNARNALSQLNKLL